MTPTAIGVTSTNWEIESKCSIACWQSREPGRGVDHNYEVRIQGFKISRKLDARFSYFGSAEILFGQNLDFLSSKLNKEGMVGIREEWIYQK